MISPNLRVNGYPLIRLTQGHNILPFDCDDDDLNDFLLNQSKLHQNDLLSVTYLLVDPEKQETVAFFSLSNDNISAQNFDSNNKFNKWRGKFMDRVKNTAKQFKSYPAMKIGRLGISKNYQNQKIGTNLINIIKLLFVLENRTGCAYITVDAYAQSLPFYTKNQFLFFGDSDIGKDTRQMYYDLSLVIKSISPADWQEIRQTLLPAIT